MQNSFPSPVPLFVTIWLLPVGSVDEAEEAPYERREGGGEAKPCAIAKRARGGAYPGEGQGEGRRSSIYSIASQVRDKLMKT